MLGYKFSGAFSCSLILGTYHVHITWLPPLPLPPTSFLSFTPSFRGGGGKTNQLTSPQGNNKHLRRLPNLLRNRPPPIPLQHLLDRLNPSLPPPHRRHWIRPPLRRRLFPSSHRNRFLSCSLWHDDDFHLHRILASDARTSPLRRRRLWLSFRAECGDREYVFFDQEGFCDWDRCCGE